MVLVAAVDDGDIPTTVAGGGTVTTSVPATDDGSRVVDIPDTADNWHPRQ